MSSEDANSGFFLFGAAPLLGAALDTDVPASARANSTAIAKRMTFPRRPLPPGAGEEPRVAILWRMARHLPSAPSAQASFMAKPQAGPRPVEQECPMRRAILTAAVAAGAAFIGSVGGAGAQVTQQPRDAPPPGTGEVPRAASPAGAVYIPGVGFRYVTPLGARVYGWYYAPTYRRYQHGYRPRNVVCDWRDTWFGARCARRWR